MKNLNLRILLLFFFSSFAFSHTHADPWDCMAKAEAERLVEYLFENPFAVDYCDPCDDLAAKYDDDRLPAFLMWVRNPRVVKCGWDEERYSVQVDYQTLAWGYTNKDYEVEKWMDPESIPEGKQPGPVYLDDPRYCITLNYHWTLENGTPSRFCFPIDFNMDMPNDGFHSFPAQKAVRDKQARKAYGKWLKKKMK